MIEKRRWPRILAEWEVLFNSISGRSGSGNRTSATVDVSEGGVRFRSRHFVAVGDRLRFTIRPSSGASLETTLTSVWVREIPSLSVFEVGGSFEDISSLGRQNLREWTASTAGWPVQFSSPFDIQ